MFNLAELQTIRVFAETHLLTPESEASARLAKSIIAEAKKLLADSKERYALLVARDALRGAHYTICNSYDPDFEDTVFSDPLREVNQTLGLNWYDPAKAGR